MKVLSTEGLTKLIQLVKSAFIKVEDVVETEEVTLADVAISGDYDDLINKPSAVTESTVSGWGFTKNTGTVTSVNNVSPVNGNVTLSIPTVPTNVSAFTNDSGYITSSALVPYVLSADLANVATSGSYNDLSNKPDLSAKANIDLSNCTKPHIVETYVNGTSWYRVYSDGWCEQGGVSAKKLQTIQLLKAYANTDYIVFGNILTTDAQQVYGNQINIMTKTTTNFSFPNSSGAQRQWHACGYIS